MNQLARIDRQMQLGSAAWGQADARTMETNTGGFIVGYSEKGKGVGIYDDRHVLLVSGSRGGKGTSVLVPNLITYPGSVVIIDPKGENAMVTARRRGGGNRFTSGMKQKVQILDPFGEVRTSYDSFSDLRAALNPLDILSASRPESVDDAARIADALIHGENAADPYWNNTARDLITALCLHVATSVDFRSNERTLVQVFDLLLAGQSDAAEVTSLLPGKKKPSPMQLLFMAMKRNKAFGGLVARYGQMFLNLERTSPKQFNGVAGVALAGLSFLKSEAMRACVSQSTFSLHELKTAARGMSLYVCLPQRYLETHFGWLRMIVSLITAEMERVKQPPATGHPLLMILDEFPALKRMRVIENAVAQIAGFGVKLVLVAQSLAQLKDHYKDNWEALVGSCGAKLFFCNDDHFTREYVSKLIGECEVVRTSVNQSVIKGRSSSSASAHGQSTTSGVSRQKSVSHTSAFPYHSSTQHGRSITRSNSASDLWTQTDTQGESMSATLGTSQSFHKRSLLTPDEVGRMFGKRGIPRALLLLSGEQPISLDRCFYFNQLGFAGYFDYHRDHPVPLTRIEAKALREERKREEAAQANARRLKAEQERLLLEQKTWKEAAKRAALQAERERRWEIAARKHRIKLYCFWIAVAVLAIAASVVLYFWWKPILFIAGIMLCLMLAIKDREEW